MKFPLALFSARRSAPYSNNQFINGNQKASTRGVFRRVAKLVVVAAVLVSGGALLIKVAGVGAATGGVDPTFNPGGSGAAYNSVGLERELTGGDSGIKAMVVQPDGKIIIGGNVHDYNGNSAPNGIMRLNPDGTLDNTFNAGGSGIDALYAGFINAFGNFVRGDGSVRALALQSDGKIIVGLDANWFNYNLQGGPPNASTTINNITRLNPDGSWDSTFNPVLPNSPAFPRNNGGLSHNGLGDARVNAIAVLPDDKILIGGRFETYNRSNRQDIDVPDGLIRLNADGSWDPTFNQGGEGFELSSDSFHLSAEIHALAVQPDGKILVGGDFGVYKTPATLTPPGPGLPLPQRLTKARGIIRLLSNGQADLFPDDLGPNVPFPLAVPVRSIALQPDGKILIGGDFTKWSSLDVPDKIMRLNASGAPDVTFNAGGAGANNSVYSIALQPDGRVLIGGKFTNYNGTDAPDHLIRLRTDGTRDTTLNPSGTGVDGDVFAIALQPNGRMLIGGQFANYNGADVPDKIMRLLPTNGEIAFASANYSVGESGGNAVIVLQRTAGSDTEVVANVTATDGTATSADYSFPPGGVSVTWPVGDSTDKVILVPIVNDGVAEPNETLTLNLSLISGGAFLSTPTATLTIQNASDPNNAPVNSVPGPQATNEDVPLVLSLANGNQISISDPDAGTNPVQVTLRGIPGFLTLNGTSGLTFPGGAFGDGTDDALIRFTGSIPDINAALNGMIFRPAAGFHGSAGLQISTDDQGNTGPGGPLTKVDLIVITVNAVADTPSVTPAATTVGVQTTSGLVISRHPSDGAEITHFKITKITGGALFKHNGTAQINNNDFITFAEGNAGLRFTPDTKAGGSFNVQSSFDNTDAGVGSGFATAAITINCLPVFVVTNSDDDGPGSLRQILRDACNGSTITFDMSPGKVTSPITLTSGMLLIDGDMAVIGPGANLLTVMRSNAAGTGKFTVLGNLADNVVISGLTISNGDTLTTGNIGSGIVHARGTLTLTGVTVSGNTGGIGILGHAAGGIYIGLGTVLNLNNSIVSGNSSEGGAGGIANLGTLNATNSSITGNTAIFAPDSLVGAFLIGVPAPRLL